MKRVCVQKGMRDTECTVQKCNSSVKHKKGKDGDGETDNDRAEHKKPQIQNNDSLYIFRAQ